MTAPPPAHSSFRRAAVVVRIEHPGGLLEHPLDIDTPEAVERLTDRLLSLLRPDLREHAVVTVIHHPKEETP